MEKVKILIDTDIGDDIDDAFAIQTALLTPELEVLGITTAFRNPIKRAKIVKALLDTNGKEIAVYAGRANPLSQEVIKLTYEQELERDGDGTICVPHYSEEFSRYAVSEGAEEFILSAADAHPGEITLLCLAPLTNIAAAYLRSPERFMKLKNIVMMGGQADGNFAEWNFRCDPEAAHVVFESGIPIRMIGINVTRHCKLSAEQVKTIFSLESESGKLFSRMLEKWLKDNRYEKPPVMHDVLATAELTQTFCGYICKNVSVSVREGTRAMICAGEHPVEMATEVRQTEFLKYFINLLRGSL